MTLFAPGASELLQVEEWDQSIQQLHSKDLPTLRADLFKLDRKTRRAGPLGMPRSWTVEIGDPERGKDAMCDDNGGLMMMGEYHLSTGELVWVVVGVGVAADGRVVAALAAVLRHDCGGRRFLL